MIRLYEAVLNLQDSFDHTAGSKAGRMHSHRCKGIHKHPNCVIGICYNNICNGKIAILQDGAPADQCILKVRNN